MSRLEERNHSIYGRIVRIASEPRTAAKGGYLFRGLELTAQRDVGRVFLIFPSFLQDLYEFPLLCWEGAEVGGFNLELNNRLGDGTTIYTVSPESDLVLEPRRPVSVTEAVEAAACIRSADVRCRVAPEEPFWMAKGKLIHTLFEHLLSSESEPSGKVFQEAFRKALPALIAVLPGSDMNVHPKALETEARTHFTNIKSWLKRNNTIFDCAEVETDRMSTRWGLKGRADAILRGKNRVTILELKSGKVPVEDHLLQLFAYSLLFSDDVSNENPEGYILYSATGRAEKLFAWGEAKKRLILEGRNRLISLKYSYTQSGPIKGKPVCGRNGKCFSRTHCNRLFAESPRPESPFSDETLRNYYDEWFRLLSIDVWAQEGEFARILDPNCLAERLDERITLRIAEMREGEKTASTHSGEALENEGEQDPESQEGSFRGPTSGGILSRELLLVDQVAEITPGEEILLHRGDLCGRDVFRVRVAESDNGRILVKLKLPFRCSQTTGPPVSEHSPLTEPSGWFVDRIPFSRGREVGRYALFNFFLKADQQVIDAVVRGESSEMECQENQESAQSHCEVSMPETGSRAADLSFSEGLLSELNEHQEAAVREALDAETFHLIHGPPGTGKTRVLARLIRICLDRGERVLVACPTNVALDRLLLALMNLGVSDFLRIGGRSNVSREFLQALERAGNGSALFQDLTVAGTDFRAFRQRVLDTKLIGATAYQCAAHPVFLTQRFDRAVIDEAGQLDEPSTLAPLAMAPKFVLGGDHFQLPPVVKTRPDQENSDGCTLERSLFERLFNSATDSRVSRLKVQYRMNREIQEIPSRLFYQGTLQPSLEAAGRRLNIETGVSDDPYINKILDPELPVVFVDVESSDTGKACPEEADLACRITEGLVACGVPPQEIGIITPYRAQQSLIRRRLFADTRYRLHLSVDTVDSFQGGEREVIILSLARSDGVTSFLADRKRLNVSLSRARSKLILLGNGPVLEQHPLFFDVLQDLERVRICCT